jgi:hypothetical protein
VEQEGYGGAKGCIMTDNVTSLEVHRALKERDNRLWSPTECLRDAIASIENGSTPCDALFVLRLNRGDGDAFNVGYNAANLVGSVALAMLEVGKTLILQDMGYLPFTHAEDK